MEDNKQITAYPDEFASNHEKSRDEYGATIGKMISGHWFGGALSNRRLWIDRMRQYSRGEQCTDQYRDTIEGKKDKSKKLNVKTHKIDYIPLKVFSTFKDILTNAIDESLFKPRAESIDITAVNRKRDYLRKMTDDFYTSDIAQIISKGIGVDITQDAPKTLKELNIKRLEFKPKLELAQELAIENVMKAEKFETIKDAIDPDLVDLGFGVGTHYTDNTEGIKLKYVDPYNYIHSPFQMEDGRDIRYHGIVEKGTIAELEKQSGGLTTEQRKKIKNHCIGQVDNEDAYSVENDGHRMVEYFTFAYPVRKKRVFKKQRKNKTLKLIDRTDDKNGEYTPVNENKKITIPHVVWYEGIYVPNADVITKWEEIPNQAEGGVNKPICPFIVYAPKIKKLSEKGETRFDSLVERAIPIIDDLHRDWYKFQQLKMELRPNTVTISPRTLNNTYLNGEKISGQDILDMYFGRGILLADEYNDDGERIGDAIKEQGGGINNNSLQFLSNEFANNYERLRQLVGINELRDGSTRPNSKTAVAVQKLLYASSNNQTSHIVKASFNISLRFAEAVSSRLYDVFTTTVLKKRYIDIIGTDNVELLDELKQYPMSKFAIYFDFKPDNEERNALERSLIDAYNKGEINVAQYNQARLIKNTKSAIKYLEYVVKINEEIKHQKNILVIKEQANANAETSVRIQEEKRKSLASEFRIFEQKELLKSKIRATEIRNKANVDELKAVREHERKLELLNVTLQSKKTIEETKSQNKKDLVDRQSSNTSKIADQKANNKPPIDFGSQINEIFKNTPLLTTEQ